MNKQFIISAAKNELELRGLFGKYEALKAAYDAGEVLFEDFIEGGHAILAEYSLLIATHLFNVSVIESMEVVDER